MDEIKKQKEYMKAYALLHKDKLRENQRRWHSKNAEKKRERVNSWYYSDSGKKYRSTNEFKQKRIKAERTCRRPVIKLI